MPADVYKFTFDCNLQNQGMPRLLITLSLLFLSISFCYPQSGEIALLNEELKGTASDTIQVNVYCALSKFYWYRNPDSAILMADQALELARKYNFKKGIALSCVNKGVALVAKGRYPDALRCHLEALKISEELKIKGLTGNNFNNIGIVYATMGNYDKAIIYYEKALAIFEEYGNAAMLPTMINIADMYSKTEGYAKAMEYNQRALNISLEEKDTANTGIILYNMGETLHKTGQDEKAMEYLQESLAISMRVRDIEGISYSYNLLSSIYLGQKQYRKSISYAEKSIENLTTAGNKEILLEAYHTLYKGYEGIKNYRKSLYYRNQEIALKEEMFSIEKEREANNLQAEYDLQRKQHEIEMLEKDKALQQREIIRDKFRTKTYMAGLALLILIITYLVISNQRRKKFNVLLKERNAAIITQKEKIDEQNAHLEKLNTVKNKLLSIISHDFRSPLNSLQSMVELIGDGTLTTADIRQMSTLMSEKLNVTVQLVENMLHWAKSQMDGTVLNAEHFDLQKVVDENVRLAKGHADTKRVHISARVATPAIAFADKATVDIVIRNLVNNAIKFSRAGDRLSLSVVDQERFVKVTVQDTGTGIPTEKQSKLFDGVGGFTTPGTSNEKGTGLGLPLCKELVEKNGGTIWFESEPGKGSSFMFTIPRDRLEVA
jgi:two-component system sensor histidine kinase/response regulator